MSRSLGLAVIAFILVSMSAVAQPCARVPAFAKQMQVRNPVFSSADRGKSGVVMQSPAGIYQHQSWQLAGSVGPLVITEEGHVLFAPAPSVNTLNNPPALQNTIYKIDSTTGVATQWLSIPVAQMPQQSNPFGIIGMFYDCASKKLFVSSVSGSSLAVPRGKLVVINVASAAIVAANESGEDYLGLALVRQQDEVILLAGMAREPRMVGIPLVLANHGARFGEARPLHTFIDGGYLRARKIVPLSKEEVEVYMTEFRYMLLGQTELRSPRIRLRRKDDGMWHEVSRTEPMLNPALMSID